MDVLYLIAMVGGLIGLFLLTEGLLLLAYRFIPWVRKRMDNFLGK